MARLLLDALTDSGTLARPHCRVTGPAGHGENSLVFRADVDGIPFPLAVKFCLDPDTGVPSITAAAQQLDALGRVYGCFGDDPDYGVPRPVPLLTEHGYVVTEWVHGRSLTSLFLDPRARFRTLSALAHRAGVWLQRLHACRPLPPAPLPAARLVAGLRDTLRESGPDVAGDPVAREAVQFLADHVPVLERRPLPRAWVHGDFKPDNLILSGERIVGLDLALRFENVVVMDLASFLVRLDLLPYHWRGLRLRLSRRRLIHAFIDGYAGLTSPVSMRALAWARLQSAINIWATRASLGKSGLKRWYAHQCFRRLARELCDDLSAANAMIARHHG